MLNLRAGRQETMIDEIGIAFDSESFSAEAFWKRRRVGYVWCTREESDLCIADLKVESSLTQRWPVGHSLLNLMGIKPRPLNLRSKGIGRLLMHCILRESKKVEIKRIWGSVTRDDIQRTPHLLDWYSRLGFDILEADGECIPTASKKIVLCDV